MCMCVCVFWSVCGCARSFSVYHGDRPWDRMTGSCHCGCFKAFIRSEKCCPLLQPGPYLILLSLFIFIYRSHTRALFFFIVHSHVLSCSLNPVYLFSGARHYYSLTVAQCDQLLQTLVLNPSWINRLDQGFDSCYNTTYKRLELFH